MALRLWLVTQNAVGGYDTYDSFIACAETAEEACSFHPSDDQKSWGYPYPSWCASPGDAAVKLIGHAEPDAQRGVILASFNAG